MKRRERTEFIALRRSQAQMAANRGDGWVALGALWGMTNAGALTWCKSNGVSQVVMDQIGRNGIALLRTAHPNKGRKYAHARLRMVDTRPSRPGVTNSYCQRWIYSGQTVSQCGADTDGHTYCPACSRHLITLTDRVPDYQPTEQKPYRWEMEIWPRKKRA